MAALVLAAVLGGPAFHARFSQVSISTASSSSGTGISAAAAGTTDIGASGAYLSPASVVMLSQAQIAEIEG